MNYPQPPQGFGPYDRSPYQLEVPPPEYLSALRPPSRKPWVYLFLVLAGAGGAAYWGYGERERLLAQAKDATTLAAEKASFAKEREALDARVKTLEEERDALKKAVEEKASELAELKGTYDGLQEKMKDEIARGDIQLTASGGRLRVDLVDKILFDSGDAALSKRGEAVLARLGAVLAAVDDKQIQVVGHTDNERITSDKLKAQWPSNWELSVARATNVVRFLQDSAQVPAERLMASGRGEFAPIASNKTAKSRARNRRIEILLTPSLAPTLISKSKLKEQHEAVAAAKSPATKPAPAGERKAALVRRR